MQLISRDLRCNSTIAIATRSTLAVYVRVPTPPVGWGCRTATPYQIPHPLPPPRLKFSRVRGFGEEFLPVSLDVKYFAVGSEDRGWRTRTQIFRWWFRGGHDSCFCPRRRLGRTTGGWRTPPRRGPRDLHSFKFFLHYILCGGFVAFCIRLAFGRRENF